MMHPDDAARLGLADGQKVRVGSRRGEVRLKVQVKAVAVPGILIAEGIWPNAAHEDGKGINTLTGADAVAPFGGRPSMTMRSG